MKSILRALVAFAVFLYLAGPAFGEIVALGKPVTLQGAFGIDGAFCGSPPSAAGSTLTDGVLLPASTCWQDGSVWWDANYAGSVNNSVEINLLGTYSMDRFSVQADNNDTYRLEYLDAGGTWQTAWDIPAVCCYGMTTRTVVLSTPVIGSALRLYATGGDNLYSVSEIATAPVDEPSTALFMVTGVLWSAVMVRQRRRLNS